MPDTTIDDLCCEFQQFVRHRRADRPDLKYVNEYLDEWVFEGDCEGVIAVHGDYELFLQTVIAIFDRCLSDPHFLDTQVSEKTRSRLIYGLVDPDREEDRLRFIDKRLFQGVVFDFMTGRRKGH